MSYYDAMREVMNHAIDHDICNLYFFHVMMGLINKAESEHNDESLKLRMENKKLRELVRDMWRDGMCDCDEFMVCAQGEYHCAECEYHYPDRMRELGIEVSDD